MVLVFLKAEIDSPRFGSTYRTILANSELDRRSVIDDPDLSSEQGTLIRRELLKLVRGYGTSQALFRGFPHNVQWRRVLLDQTDLSKLKYANEPSRVALSSGSRLVSQGSENVGSGNSTGDTVVNTRAIVEDFKRGKVFPELIGVDRAAGEIILMEGHTRATAYALAKVPSQIECIVGSSVSMSNWAFY